MYPQQEDWQFFAQDEVEDAICCAVCDKPIEADEWDNRHSGHETYCPNHESNQVEDEDGELCAKDENGDLVDMVDCFCDLEYHAECCPDCNQ